MRRRRCSLLWSILWRCIQMWPRDCERRARRCGGKEVVSRKTQYGICDWASPHADTRPKGSPQPGHSSTSPFDYSPLSRSSKSRMSYHCRTQASLLTPSIRRTVRPSLLPSPNGGKPLYMPANTSIILTTVLAHRDKSVWGEDAEVFDIDRWSTMGKEREAFTSWNIGPRMVSSSSRTPLDKLMSLCVHSSAWASH